MILIHSLPPKIAFQQKTFFEINEFDTKTPTNN